MPGLVLVASHQGRAGQGQCPLHWQVPAGLASFSTARWPGGMEACHRGINSLLWFFPSRKDAFLAYTDDACDALWFKIVIQDWTT
jgi:hypothetical protein